MFTPGSPAALGYRMPAEWEPHRATWLSWPHNRESWPGKFELVPPIWGEFVRVVAAGEHVEILAGPPDTLADAEQHVGSIPNCRIHPIPTNDAWIRDHGPTFLVGSSDLPPALLNWEYNAWGGKYPPWDLDNQVPQRIVDLLGRKCFEPGIVLEGGSIDVNGRGSVLVTEQCLLNSNRNPQLSKQEIEQYLSDFLAAPNVLWLGEGICGDDTDGHVDDITRFVGPREVVTVVEADPLEENYQPLQENLQRLKSMRDEAGRDFTVIELPMPRPLFHEGQRLPASYANFYIANQVLVVPTFDDPADQQALDILQALFPKRRIVGIRSVDLVWGLGAFHCMTQQEPALR